MANEREIHASLSHGPRPSHSPTHGAHPPTRHSPSHATVPPSRLPPSPGKPMLQRNDSLERDGRLGRARQGTAGCGRQGRRAPHSTPPTAATKRGSPACQPLAGQAPTGAPMLASRALARALPRVPTPVLTSYSATRLFTTRTSPLARPLARLAASPLPCRPRRIGLTVTIPTMNPLSIQWRPFNGVAIL